MKKIIIGVLVIIEIISLYMMYQSNESKKTILDNVKVVENTNNKFAIQYQVNDAYIETDKFLGKEDGYILNTELSKCQNEEGFLLNNVISYDNNKKALTISTDNTSYCYLYFDEEENLKNICNSSNLSECMVQHSDKLESINNLNANQAGMYRYQGSNDVVTNNYICFGTDDVDVCRENEDKYMYRIIGITNDGIMKLIKKIALNDTGFNWNNISRSTWNEKGKINDADVPWSQSDLFKRLNGLSSNNDNLFIGNSSFDYLKSGSNWLEKIKENTWMNGTIGPVNSYYEPKTIYDIENGTIETNYYKEENVYIYNGGNFENVDNNYNEVRDKDEVKCKILGNKEKIICYKIEPNKFVSGSNNKIGLMNITDFEYSVELGGKNCFIDTIWNRETGTYQTEGEKCIASWMHLTNNDTNNLDDGRDDWTITAGGLSDYYGDMTAVAINYLGYVESGIFSLFISARPVFFLNNNISIKSGNGSINNPYILV